MSHLSQKLMLILDDREFTSAEVRAIVGTRHFGDITYKRQNLADHFRGALPEWARNCLVHLRTVDDVIALRARLESASEECALCIVAGRAGFAEPALLRQLIERLPYSEIDFSDRLFKPMLVFMRSGHRLLERWQHFQAAPIHTWELAWQDSQRVQSVKPLDLAKISDFLALFQGSTATRYFNEVHIDPYYYTKRSSDKRKMHAEYAFYNLAPESLRPWLIQPFDYQDQGEYASYKMLRYYLADAALQWVHGAFEADSFGAFIDRLLFFLSERPHKACSKEQSAKKARELFVDKLKARIQQFLATEEGRRINALVASTSPDLEINRQVERFIALYQRYEKNFVVDTEVVGHGDPCLSNILYDQRHFLLKFIDPKGAISEENLWTHPLYDLCKISHSVLGDYDFINNGLYRVGFTDNNHLLLHFTHSNHLELKQLFIERIKALGHNTHTMRLGEASLFLSMLPLHIDHPNKVMAFMVKAKHVLDEVEGE